MKIIRYVAFVLGGVVALLAALVIIASLTFDSDRIKAEVITAVRENLQRELAIEESLELSFWPSLGVNLGRATLSEQGPQKEFAAIERARVSLAVMPLLRRQLVVDTLQLEGLRAMLIRAKDGKLNIDDLLGSPQQTKSETSLAFDVAGVRIVNAALTYVDEQAGRTVSLTDLNLNSGRLGNAAAGRLELALRIGADAPKLKLVVQAEGDYRYDLAGRQYAFSALKLSADGDAAAFMALDLGLTADSLRLDGGTGAMEADALHLSAKGKQGAENFIATLQAPRFAMQDNEASSAAIDGQLTLVGGPRELTARIHLDRLSGAADTLRVAELKLDVDARQGDTALKGSLTTPVSADIRSQTLELPSLVGDLSLSYPHMSMKTLKLPIDGKARADFAKSTAAGELATRLDESQVQGRFSVARFSPPALSFELDIDTLDLDKYLPPAPKGETASGPEPPVDFSAIGNLDLNGRVRVGALQVSRVKAQNVRLDLRARNGRLDVSPLSASLYQGKLDGSLSLIAKGNQLRLKQNLSNVQINPLMRDAVDKDLIEGRGNLSLDVASAGAGPAALKKALSGTARVQLRDGAIKGINLAKSLREIKARVGGKEDAVQAADSAAKTDFTELTASFRIANGVARNDDLAAKSPFLRLAGAGDIDLGEGRMDYLVKASVVGTAKGQEGKELAQLKGLSVPVKVTGPFDSLSYRIEAAALMTDLAKTKAREAVQEVRQDIQRKATDALLKDGIKGLLK